jgi:hypothetical protein
MIAFILGGELTEISCATVTDLRDNNFNFGGLAIWDGIGQMARKDHIEAEAIAAVSQAEYLSRQKLVNRTLYGPPISSYEGPRSGMQSAYTIVGLFFAK